MHLAVGADLDDVEVADLHFRFRPYREYRVHELSGDVEAELAELSLLLELVHHVFLGLEGLVLVIIRARVFHDDRHLLNDRGPIQHPPHRLFEFFGIVVN